MNGASIVVSSINFSNLPHTRNYPLRPLSCVCARRSWTVRGTRGRGCVKIPKATLPRDSGTCYHVIRLKSKLTFAAISCQQNNTTPPLESPRVYQIGLVTCWCVRSSDVLFMCFLSRGTLATIAPL